MSEGMQATSRRINESSFYFNMEVNFNLHMFFTNFFGLSLQDSSQWKKTCHKEAFFNL